MSDHGILGYIDPGSGFIVIQVIAAGILGGMFYFRKIFLRIVSVIPGVRKPPDDSPPAAGKETDATAAPNRGSGG